MVSRNANIALSWIAFAVVSVSLVAVIFRGMQIQSTTNLTKMFYFFLGGFDDFLILELLLGPISNYYANYYTVYPLAGAAVFSLLAAIFSSTRD